MTSRENVFGHEAKFLGRREDVAREGGKGKAFKGKRDVGKGEGRMGFGRCRG